MREMKTCFCILTKSFKMQKMYYKSVIANFFSTLVSIFVQYKIWESLLAYNDSGILLEDMMRYVLFNISVLTIINNDVAKTVEDDIRTGIVELKLLRPISYKNNQLFEVLGKNIYIFFFSVLPISLFMKFYMGLANKRSLTDILIVSVFLLIGIVIMFEVNYIIGIFAFWLQTSWFMKFYLNAFISLFGGTIVPLYFYPEWLARICDFLPFEYISYKAINFYLYEQNYSKAMVDIFVGFFWIIIIAFLEKMFWRVTKNKLCINGG